MMYVLTEIRDLLSAAVFFCAICGWAIAMGA